MVDSVVRPEFEKNKFSCFTIPLRRATTTAILLEANTLKVLHKLKIRRSRLVMEHPRQLLVMVFKPLRLLRHIMFRNKLKRRDKLFKRHIPPARRQLMHNKVPPHKEELMATQQDSKMLLHRLHQQTPPLIKRLTTLIKRTTPPHSTTTEKLTKRKQRRPLRLLTIRNNLLLMCKVDRALTTLRTPPR